MHRRTLLLIASAAFAAPLTATARAVHMMHPSFAQARATGAPGVAPMLFVMGAMPAVAVTIEGKGPYTFGIDTGADGYAHIGDPLARQLGLAVVGKALESDPSWKNPIPISRYRIGELAFAGLTFHDITAEGMPELAGHAALFDGILGMDLFDALTLTLDFKGHTVALSTDPVPKADQASIFSYPPGPTIRLPLTVGGSTFEADLDTGNMNAPLLFPTEWISRLPSHGAPQKRGVAHSVSQTVQIFAVSIDAPVHVGAIALPTKEILYPNVAPVANIGSRALQGMTVRVDRVNRRVQLIA